MPRVRISNAQKKFASNGVSFYIAIDGVIEAIAAGFAVTDSMKDPRYTDAIVDEAFERADQVFNVGAEALGKTGAIAHMYEWGTLGINKGRTNVRLQPSSPAARLWHNYTEGHGLERTLWLAYRPSVANIPKPTVGASGMSVEDISRLKDHVFRWKAEVMEEGQEVTIARKSRTKWLLIPAYEQNRQFMRKNDIKRGYMLTKGPLTVTPGRKVQGNFREFWTGFWNEQGAEIVEEYIQDQILLDYEPEFRRARTTKTLRPVGTMTITSDIMKEKKKTQARVIKKARARRLKK